VPVSRGNRIGWDTSRSRRRFSDSNIEGKESGAGQVWSFAVGGGKGHADIGGAAAAVLDEVLRFQGNG